MYRFLTALSLVTFFLNGMQQYEYWPDSTFSLEELEKEDPGNGVRTLCEQMLQVCHLKNLDDYHCRLRHHLEYVKGGWFMDIYFNEKSTNERVCAFELNRQTSELKRIH